MSTRLNRRLLGGEYVVIVVGVLVALWVDQIREARVEAQLEVLALKRGRPGSDMQTDLIAQVMACSLPPMRQADI